MRINGEMHYLWRAVDHQGEVPESFVTKRRDRKAALKFLKKTMKRYGQPSGSLAQWQTEQHLQCQTKPDGGIAKPFRPPSLAGLFGEPGSCCGRTRSTRSHVYAAMHCSWTSSPFDHGGKRVLVYCQSDLSDSSGESHMAFMQKRLRKWPVKNHL